MAKKSKFVVSRLRVAK